MLLSSGTSHIGPLGWIRRKIVPVGAFLIVTEPLPKQTLERLLPLRRMAVAILHATLHNVFPAPREARIDYRWGGKVDMTRDRLPRAGERNGIYDSMGYSGHGERLSDPMELRRDEMEWVRAPAG